MAFAAFLSCHTLFFLNPLQEIKYMSDIRSLPYWVGHFLAVASTVVGVYLAAVVGFDVAVKLTLVESDRGTYYLAESMHQELEFNAANMQKYIDKVEGKPYVYKEHLAGIKLNDYVFQASKYTDSVFEIDPTLLSQISTFYFAVGNAIQAYYDSNMASPANVIAVVKRETKKLQEQGTLDRLAAYNAVLTENLKKQGINVAQPTY